MAFDFPNSPSVGQRVTGVGGIVYVWDGVKWTNSVGGVTVQSMGDVGRNLIHNPLFNVAQRGAGAWTTTGYTLDRWQAVVVTDAVSITRNQLASPDVAQIGDEEAIASLSNVFTGNAAAGALSQVLQPIEKVRRLAGKTVTVSFYAKATATQKLGININQVFGTGGSPSTAGRVLATGNAVTLSTTWTRYNSTIAIPSVAAKTLGTNGDDFSALEFWYSSGATYNSASGNIGVQSGTIQLWGVQLEVGSVATPLEKPDPQQDLAKCQRFFFIGQLVTGGYQLGTASIYGTGPLPVTMRAAPTVTLGGTSSANIGTIAWGANPGNASVNAGAAATVTGTAIINATYIASADL